ncbi:MAG: cation diffusion facilitator family transporter [Chryseolinea sp.]
MSKNLKSIYSALIANGLIAITKFIAGAFTNSSSMISEGIHSVVDTVNQLLLLYGLRRSKKPANERHPFGYGKELYFWAFMVSILIFGVGGGVSIYHGIGFLLHPESLDNPKVNYIVLGLSLLFEVISFYIALKEFNLSRGELHWWSAVKNSKDPSSFLVLFEDAAALGGLLIVLILMLINQAFDLPYLDGVASIMVGLLLVSVSLFLGRESRSLLMGEGVSPETQEKVKVLVETDEAVLKVTEVLSTYQSPEEVILMLKVQFKPDMDTSKITAAIERITQSIRARFRHVAYVLIQPA